MPKFLPPVRSVLAALAYTGAQYLLDRAQQLDPHLPDRLCVVPDLWCYLPEHKHLVTVTSAIPDVTLSITRYAFVTVAYVRDPDDDAPTAYVLLNHRETRHAMYGRDPEGFPVDPEDYDIPRSRVATPEPPPADMDALIRRARASNTLN
jgi:hypothetical protein